MLLRRTTPLAIVMAALACEPPVPFDASTNNPTAIDYAAFDPTGSPPDIPLPNDLALQPQAIASVASQSPAQAALLTIWQSEGFPNDQEVPITIDFVEVKIDPATGAQTRVAPQLDVSSINAGNLIVLSASLSGAGSGAVAYDPPKAADYAVVGDHGQLTIHKSADPNNGGSRRWPANSEIIVAVRGGTGGVKVTGGGAGGLQPQAAMYLLLQDKDLTLAENQSLLPGNTREQKAATGAQLETLRKGYLIPFAAIDQAWGAGAHHQIATMGTFKIADTAKRAHVETDPSAGRVPLPSDFLFENGHLSADGQAAFNAQAAGLGTGLATLDGFSTTAMILSQTSTPVLAGSIPGGVFIFELQPTATPPFKRLNDISELAAGKTPSYVAEPPPITQEAAGPNAGKECTLGATGYDAACVSTAIGLQPAVPARLPTGAVLALPPLKEATTYVVLVSDSVKDLNGDPLTRSTLGKILFLDPSINVAAGGHSTVQGVTDSQAVGIDQMRQAINGAAQVLAAEKSGMTRDHLVMGYTFKTQSITGVAAQLAALPYAFQTANITPVSGTTPTVYCSPGLVNVLPGCVGAPPANSAAFSAYGVDPTVVPLADIGTITEAQITTYNKLICKAGDTTCTDTGAFNPNPDPASAFQETITALVATPLPPYGGTCIPGPAGSGGNSPNGVCTLPLIVFRHGFGGSKSSMLAVADRLVKAGFVVAAIDADKQGDRAFCQVDAECASNSCVHDNQFKGEGDSSGATPGHCSGGITDFVRDTTTCPAAHCTNTKSTPKASANFVISANFFRTRDTFRQDIIDEAQLVRVLSPNPFCDKAAPPPPNPGSANTCANQIITASTGIQIDPAKIYYAGQSLGAINGTVDAAANPRISRAALNVGGSTLTDIFTDPNSSFAPDANALFTSLGITPGSAAYLQLINVAKWILDPADAENFGGHLLANNLPNFIADQTGHTAQSSKAVLGQMALCDGTVPNTWGANLYTLAGLPFNQSAAGANANTATAAMSIFVAGGGTACPANGVKHAFLVDWVDYAGATNIAQTGQDDIAGFFADTAVVPPPVRSAP